MTTNTVEHKTAEQIVKEKFPTAFVDDDGTFVSIRDKKLVSEACPHCGQRWDHMVVNQVSLGSGGNADYAWKSAANAIAHQM